MQTGINPERAMHGSWKPAEGDGPRERMMGLGPYSMSDMELLTILLSPGSKSVPCDMIARDLLAEFGSMKGLVERRTGELASIRGLGRAKACRVLAAIEMGRRAFMSGGEASVMSTARDVNERCMGLAGERDEVFCAIAVNSRNRVKGEWVVARGWESGVNLTPRQVFTLLVKESVSRVIFVHNHPSGDPTPSAEDFRFTERLIEAARCLTIRVLDHVIVATDGFTSLREDAGGRLDFG